MVNFKSCTSIQPFIRTPSCQVCLEPYDETQHIPKILQCAHTVCEQCINVLGEQGRQNNTPRPLDRSFVHITCPVCRTVTQTPRTYIRTNYQLIDVVDGMNGVATQNVVFVTCTECQGVYHEKDVNICTRCAPINENTEASTLLAQNVALSTYALCSTCLLRDHIAKGHVFIRLQPIRVEMQKQENLQQMDKLQEKLIMTQRTFREKFNRTIDKWMIWTANRDESLIQFKQAVDSFTQKKMFDDFAKQITKKTEKIERQMNKIQKWSDEMEVDSPQAMTIPPPTPPRPRAPTPHEPLGADYLYYFEQ